VVCDVADRGSRRDLGHPVIFEVRHFRRSGNRVPRPGKYLPALAQDPTVLDRMRRFIFPNRFLI
jgi:hypothetical protein